MTGHGDFMLSEVSQMQNGKYVRHMWTRNKGVDELSYKREVESQTQNAYLWLPRRNWRW